ncbi:MAG TPA: YidC/Oxa1 family membrane protein insertase [Actinomycetota bacterium]
MLAEIGPFQALLDAIGWLLAWVYDQVGSFGIAIIILTIVFRIVLLPLGIKQIKAMQATQALQPKVKEIQRKYKGNRQKIQEEQMKLYQEYGVNPFGGCLPVLLQFPILIAMYSVIRAPVPYAPEDRPTPSAEFKDNHLPEDSALFRDVTSHEERGQRFLLMNLQCSPSNAGRTVPVLDTQGEQFDGQEIRCGDSIPDRIPYYALLALMIGSTYYSMRQTQKATPASAQNPQTAMISRIMPLTFGIFGFTVPAGLVLYWTMSSVFQIAQQSVMLRLGHIGPEAMDRRLDQVRAKAASKGDRRRTGFMGQMMERAEQERKRRTSDSPTLRKPPPRTPKKGTPGANQPKRSSGSQGRSKGSGPNRPKRRGR